MPASRTGPRRPRLLQPLSSTTFLERSTRSVLSRRVFTTFQKVRLLFARYNVDYGIIIPMPAAPPPSLTSLCDLVLQGIPNPSTRSMYGKALRDFLTWLEHKAKRR